MTIFWKHFQSAWAFLIIWLLWLCVLFLLRLSPYLFILSTYIFLSLLSKAKDNGSIHKIQIVRGSKAYSKSDDRLNSSKYLKHIPPHSFFIVSSPIKRSPQKRIYHSLNFISNKRKHTLWVTFLATHYEAI